MFSNCLKGLRGRIVQDSQQVFGVKLEVIAKDRLETDTNIAGFF